MAPGLTSTRYPPPISGCRSAALPFHLINFTGSVKNSKMVSGLAAILTSRVTLVGLSVCTATPLLVLNRLFQVRKTLFPEPFKDAPQPAQPIGVGPVEAERAVAALGHEIRLLQDTEMLRDG